MLNLKDFGAIGDGLADDTQAIQSWIDAIVATGEKGFIPRGRYMSSERVLFPLPGDQQVILEGEGAYQSVINTRRAPQNQGPQIHFYSNNPVPNNPTSTYPTVSNMCFASDTPGTVCAIALEDFSDNIGNANFTNVSFRNDNSTLGPDAVSLQLNHVFCSSFNNVVCVGRVGYGNALDLRASVFNTFTGSSFSNAGRGIRFRDTGSSALASLNNLFNNTDIENVNYGIVVEEAGCHTNVFQTVYFDIWRPDLSPAQNAPGYAIYASANGGLIVRQPYLHLGPTPLVDPSHNWNVTVQ